MHEVLKDPESKLPLHISNLSRIFATLIAHKYNYFLCTLADVAVRKHHQRQDEILIIFPRTILESAKLFFCRKHVHF